MKISFESPEAADLNERIFETIYYGAVSESVNIAKK
jgi:ribonucleotide reductase alpha subunit